MKKIYFIIALLFAGNLAVAQTSVWHGGREMWTRGEGTEESPFLIESADQLAMLSYVVNKGFSTKYLYFKLTTDIDLNGSEDQRWDPIGSFYYYEDGCEREDKVVAYSYFSGNFDGGDHAISNIYVDCKSYAGLFGKVSDTVVLKNIRIVSGYIKGDVTGSIVGLVSSYSRALISDCTNYAEIYGTGMAGGIVGQGGSVKRCNNKGKVTAEYSAGGIAGSNSRIEQSYNTGDVISKGTIAGGVVGSIMGIRNIENCYNTGSVTALAEGKVEAKGCGGILGLGYSTLDGINLHNCYNVGDIDGLDGFTGSVVGQGVGMVSVSNCYYLNTCGAQGLGVAMDEDAMRIPDFVATLNDNTDVWNMDEENHNSGFPILMGLDMAVDEVSENGFVVYPNPTQGTLRIEGGHFEEVEIFNVLGVRVMQRNLHGCDGTATLDVSILTDGLYLLRVTDAQKAYRICQFVVRH